MSIKLLKHRIENLRNAAESFESAIDMIEFTGVENKAESLDELEGIFLAIDDLEDILDRDLELKTMKEALE